MRKELRISSVPLLSSLLVTRWITILFSYFLSCCGTDVTKKLNARRRSESGYSACKKLADCSISLVSRDASINATLEASCTYLVSKVDVYFDNLVIPHKLRDGEQRILHIENKYGRLFFCSPTSREALTGRGEKHETREPLTQRQTRCFPNPHASSPRPPCVVRSP